MVVMNNQVAHIQVGNKVPINTTSISPTTGSTTTYSEATYLDTGVILNVQPRVNPGGLVYLNIGQQVSQVDRTQQLVNGNPTISQRELATQVAVQSGQTVLLGGLIQQDEGTSDSGVPVLSRIPVVGRLFGSTSRTHNRTELIVLITPRVISSADDARQITDEYQQKFESLAPLRAQPKP
jgi:general secretion pathway protein D